MPKGNYARTVNMTEDLEQAWQTYKREWPKETFSGTVCMLLAHYFEKRKAEALCKTI